MEAIENALTAIDYLLDTRRKRHVLGGVMLSVSMLFGGLALTIMTIRNEVDNK